MTEKWFEPGKEMGWKKDAPQEARRRVALRSRKGDALATGRGLMALSNVTRDKETARKAKSDATYFFQLHKKTGRRIM